MPTFRFCNIRTGRFAEATMNDNVFDQGDAAAAAAAAAAADDDVKDEVARWRSPCSCSTVALADGCDGKYLVLDYGTFCRALDFDPWLPIMFDSSEYYVHPWEKYTGEYNLDIMYPWQPFPLGPWKEYPGIARPESSFGDRNDYDTVENHFGWVDHTNPVIAIPMHRYYTESPGLIQLMQPIVLGDLGDNCVPAKPINVVIDTSVVGGNE